MNIDIMKANNGFIVFLDIGKDLSPIQKDETNTFVFTSRTDLIKFLNIKIKVDLENDKSN